MRLVLLDKESPSKPVVKEVKEQEVYMGEMPLMTPTGSFVINGTERGDRVPAAFVRLACSSSTTRARRTARASCFSRRVSSLTVARGSTTNSIRKTCCISASTVVGKCPVTILLKAIGLTPEQILAHFFVFDNFALMGEGAQMEFVPERLRGEVARFDIQGSRRCGYRPEGQADQRQSTFVTYEAAKTKFISVPEDYLLGRVLAKNVVDGDTGEVIANAERRDHRNGAREACARSKVKDIQTLYTNDLDQGPYISSTLRIDETADRMAARIAIYRMMRPGEPPTEEAVEALFKPFVLQRRRVRPVEGWPYEVQPSRVSRRDHGAR